MAFYLSFKEIWRNRVRFLLISGVIALITTLVLFIAALAQGLGLANKEYISKLDAELLIFEDTADRLASSSQIRRTKLNDINRIEGVADVGSIGFSSATIVYPVNGEPLDVSLIGVDPNKPGAPPLVQGNNFSTSRSSEVILDQNAIMDTNIRVGDEITIETIQGDDESYHKLKVVGTTDGRQYLFAPSIFVPYRTWDEIRPQAIGSSLMELTANVVAVKLVNPADQERLIQQIQNQVPGTDAVDLTTAIEAIPGYLAQQSTLNTQQFFTLLIGILVIGGFFQIQMLQKIPQIGVLKAVGASNITVASAVVIQIILITTFGVMLGGLVTFLLSIALPSNIPIMFSGQSIVIAVISLLLIGPVGGLVSVRQAVSVEPLIALRL